jgi:hypothetical protein
MLAAAAGRRRLLRVAVLAAALLLVVAVPAAMARRALPGTPLWPLRQAGQQVRLALAGDAVDRASLHLDRAELLLRAAAGAGSSDREDLVAKARAQVQAALDALGGRGPEAADQQARAGRLLAALAALEREDDRGGPGGDRSGPGGGSGGSGGPGGSGSSGPESGSGSSGSGSGSSGSGFGSSGSGSGTSSLELRAGSSASSGSGSGGG